jgi:hypothetical protein
LFDPTSDARRALEKLADEIPEIQQTLIKNQHQLKSPDRAAHQQQIAHVGIGRVSTGLGCPHLETDPDFLGLMLAPAKAFGWPRRS